MVSVESKNIVRFYGASVSPYLCMVLELCERGSVYDFLKKFPEKLSWPLAIHFGSDMAEGMAALHAHSPPIVHRDLKSMNLLITKKWDVKVCDFGLSRIYQQNLETFSRICGTMAYIAPEMISGQGATKASDVYAMGIVLWEFLYVVMKNLMQNYSLKEFLILL